MRSRLVSTIVPVFNRSAMLREAVASVLAQTYRPIEILIIDDESTDDTPTTIAALSAQHPEIRAIRRSNGGPGLARESGRLAASGEFIQYLDSDDLLLPRKFERQVAALDAHPECGVAYGITRYRDPSGDEIWWDWKATEHHQTRMFPSFLVSRWWETSTPLYRRAVTDEAGAWTALRLEEDWEYDCRVAALGVCPVFVEHVVAEYRDHPGERLTRGGTLDPRRLADRATAHERIAEHAIRAGIPHEAAEMQTFARELFKVARLCGAAGLREDSKRLLAIARAISSKPDLGIYESAATLIGWRAAGRLSMLIDRLRAR